MIALRMYLDETARAFVTDGRRSYFSDLFGPRHSVGGTFTAWDYLTEHRFTLTYVGDKILTDIGSGQDYVLGIGRPS
jgi:hypothetical protein